MRLLAVDTTNTIQGFAWGQDTNGAWVPQAYPQSVSVVAQQLVHKIGPKTPGVETTPPTELTAYVAANGDLGVLDQTGTRVDNHTTTLGTASRWFDLEWLANGTAVLVFSDGSNGKPKFSVRNTSGAWSGDADVNPSGMPNPATVTWVELEANANRTQLSLVFCDNAFDLFAVRFVSGAWQDPTRLETELHRTTTVGVRNRPFDTAFESSGELMVVWARNVANDHGLFWATYTNQAWSVPAHYQNALPSGRSHHVDLAVQPGGDRMVAGLFDLGDMVERVGAGIWNGDSWEDGTELDSQARDVEDTALEDWMGAVAMDAQGQALLVYADTVVGDLRYFVNDAAGGWTPPAGVTLVELGLVESVMLQPMASGMATMMVMTTDAGLLHSAVFRNSQWTNHAVLPVTTPTNRLPFSFDVRR
jgi:hypothetical protein